jgi:hypothetical protein
MTDENILGAHKYIIYGGYWRGQSLQKALPPAVERKNCMEMS